MPQSRVNHLASVITEFPSLKRKRQSEGYQNSPAGSSTDTKTCFTNSAFSSTPKKIVARRRAPITITNNFIQNPCFEVKSISDIINTPVEEKHASEPPAVKQSQNPYEVVRKPPKKKKRESEIIEACFENPALNLDLPEKQFNPYEVLRELPEKQTNAIQSNCFVNAALNLRSQDVSATRNPYEIERFNNVQPLVVGVGVENATLEDGPTTATELKIDLPFRPTVGCRIDFSNLPIEQLTPSKLLADKLVFSPVLVMQKRSIDSTSEESSMDIGKELDRYQLELENSINEAKMRKASGTCVESQTDALTLQIEVEQKLTFTQRLEEIVEEDEEKENYCCDEEVIKITTEQEYAIELPGKAHTKTVVCQQHDQDQIQNEDVAYASDSDDDELDFKEPAPFVRAYQRATEPHAAVSKESLQSNGSKDLTSDHKKSSNVRNIIRKSLRKLMHPIKHDSMSNDCANTKEKHLENEEVKTKEKQEHSTAYKIIRNSFRRKPTPKIIRGNTQQESVVTAEISIIDTSERTMKLKAELLPKTEEERKHTLRNSLRRTTREMGQHLFKTVFHKNQKAYEFSK